MKVLEKRKAMGKEPQALRDRPDLPWYYQAYFNHFLTLSGGRNFSYILIQKTDGKKTKQEVISIPATIDILTILGYNKHIAKRDDEEFVDIICTLDVMFVNNYRSKNS